MKVGFTGSHKGMTDAQRRAFIALVLVKGCTEFHHGCCLGADADAWEVMASATDLGFATPKVVAHPPKNQSWVSESALMLADERREPRDYLERDRDIVDETDLLVACPEETAEQSRGGTWYTVRCARRWHRKVVIIWPDGVVTTEGGVT